jgi:streptogramin lyase
MIGLLAVTARAPAATPTITEFSSGLQASNASIPSEVAAGPDGNMWFTDQATTRAVRRITLAGSSTEFSSGLHGTPSAITSAVQLSLIHPR